jgi:hypothetical protein
MEIEICLKNDTMEIWNIYNIYFGFFYHFFQFFLLLTELNNLSLKLCSKKYNKIDLFYLIVVPQLIGVAGDITIQPKQGTRLCHWAAYLFSYDWYFRRPREASKLQKCTLKWDLK